MLPANAATAGPYIVNITATDTQGLSASDSFTIQAHAAPLGAQSGAWTINGANASTSMSNGITVSVSFTTAGNASLTLVGTDTLSANPAYGSNDVPGDPSLNATFNWDTTPEASADPAAADAGSGTMTITFSEPVTNPVIYLDRMGGHGDWIANSMALTLQTAGITLQEIGGTKSFEVDEVTGIIRRTTGTVMNGTATGETNLDPLEGTAGGAVRLIGTFTTVSFAMSPAAGSVEGAGGDGFELAFEVNDAPVDGNETNTATEDVTLTVNDGAAGDLLNNATDADGNPLTITAFSVAGQVGPFTVGSPFLISGVGTLTINANGSYTFAPAANYNGSVPVITYTVSDGTATDTSTLTLSITAVNDAPVDGNETNTTNEDTTLTVADGATGDLLNNATDADGNPLTITAFSVAGQAGPFTIGSPFLISGVGTLTVNANGSYTFVPTTNYNGSVPVITYTVSDGTATDTSTLTLSVSAVNDAPVDGNETNTTNEDTTLTVADGATGDLLNNATDADGNPLTITAFSVAGQAGPFTVGSPFLISGVGTLTVNANGSYTFVPTTNYNGSVPVITYTVSDGTATDTSTLTLSVTAVNDAPVDGNETNTTNEDTTLTVADGATGDLLNNATDADGNPLTITAFSVAGQVGPFTVGSPFLISGVGTLTINANGSYTFVPTTNYNGSVPVITYTVSDGTATDTSTLTLSVSAVNDAPVDGNETNTTNEDTTLTVADGATGDLLNNATDADGNPLTITAFSVAGQAGPFTVGSPFLISGVGTLTVNANGSYTFVPATNYNGSVPVITYTVSDGTATDTSTLTLSVTTENDRPILDVDGSTSTIWDAGLEWHHNNATDRFEGVTTSPYVTLVEDLTVGSGLTADLSTSRMLIQNATALTFEAAVAGEISSSTASPQGPTQGSISSSMVSPIPIGTIAPLSRSQSQYPRTASQAPN